MFKVRPREKRASPQSAARGRRTAGSEAPSGFLSPANAGLIAAAAIGGSFLGYKALRWYAETSVEPRNPSSREENNPPGGAEGAQPKTALPEEELEQRTGRSSDSKIFSPDEVHAAKSSPEPSFPAVAVTAGRAKVLSEVGDAEETNRRWRRSMEDTHIVVENFHGDPGMALLAVFDGHSGNLTALMLKAWFAEHLQEALRNSTTVADAFRLAHETLDKKILKDDGFDGATSTVVLVVRNSDGKSRTVYAANAGDGRAVFCRRGGPLRLTRDHKPTDDDEKARIEQAGAVVDENGRINGGVNVSRGFGDKHYKNDNLIITAEPYTFEVDVEDGDDYVIVACDGLWDVMSDDEACAVAHQAGGAQAAAAALIAESIKKGTKDNVTVVVGRL